MSVHDALPQRKIGGLGVYEHGVIIERKGFLINVQNPRGKTAWYRECELQPAAFDKRYISQACIQNGVLGVRVENTFMPVSQYRRDLQISSIRVPDTLRYTKYAILLTFVHL